ncbi:MAG: hypothetical protein IKV66_12980 [Clostridia bacterium]|nr:hypothetical protein [Clostridia bacterium]
MILYLFFIDFVFSKNKSPHAIVFMKTQQMRTVRFFGCRKDWLLLGYHKRRAAHVKEIKVIKHIRKHDCSSFVDFVVTHYTLLFRICQWALEKNSGKLQKNANVFRVVERVVGGLDGCYGRRRHSSVTVGRCLGAAAMGAQHTNLGYETWNIYIF